MILWLVMFVIIFTQFLISKYFLSLTLSLFYSDEKVSPEVCILKNDLGPREDRARKFTSQKQNTPSFSRLSPMLVTQGTWLSIIRDLW